MIDFNDPAEIMNHGEAIPINTQEKYDAVRVLAKDAYEKNDGPTWDGDMDQQLERRVRDGMPIEAILAETKKDRGRKTNTPGA